MPKYKKSNGEMIDKKIIDRKVNETKKLFLQNFFEEHGYYFCERTGRVDMALDCSHIISVRMCQAMGKSELAYSVDNLELLSRDSHLSLEEKSNKFREDYYHAKKEGMTYKDFKTWNLVF